MKSQTILFFSILLTVCITLKIQGQTNEKYKREIELDAIGTTSGVVPFWMRSNQFGSIPSSGVSSSLIGKFSKVYVHENGVSMIDQDAYKLVDWGFNFEGRANGGEYSKFLLIDASVKLKVGIFQLKGGRSRDVEGIITDNSLTSGNFSISGNSLGIPKIEVSIPNFYSLPILDKLFSIRGNFSHGWIGKVRVTESIDVDAKDTTRKLSIKNPNPSTYLHSKSFYVRLGKPTWRLNLSGGFNHQVFWGNEQAYGTTFDLSQFETFLYVATGKTYSAGGVLSKIGNQLGSIDMAMSYDFNNFKLTLYRQSFYDVGALSKLANISDGLNGITVQRKITTNNSQTLQFSKGTLEFFSSKNQAGYPWSKFTASGDEDYYNNYYYRDGWSYKNAGIGTPLITSKNDIKAGQATSARDYFVNNRVVAIHAGADATLKNLEFTFKTTFSFNYGTFGTSIYGNSTGLIRSPPPKNIFTPVHQLSLYFKATRPLANGMVVGIASAFDEGELLKNSLGVLISFKKEFH
jgi:hypothetical protein